MSAMKRFARQIFGRRTHTVRNSDPDHRTRLACEGLEVREMPAGLTAALQGQTLLVTGTEGADSIVVRQDAGKISVNGATITKNGVAVASVLASQVTKVQVDARGGNDSVWLVDLGGAGTAADKARVVIVNAGDGNDFVGTGLGQNTVFGGNGNDDLEGFKPGSSNTFSGEAGDDVIDLSRVTAPQLSVLDGGDGNDAIHGSQGADQMYGGAGNDYLWGNAGDDSIDGGSGKNVIDGGKGADTFYSTGTDTFTSRESADRIVTPSTAPTAPQASAQPAVASQPALVKPAAGAVPAPEALKVQTAEPVGLAKSASVPVASAAPVQGATEGKVSVPTVAPVVVGTGGTGVAGAVAEASTKLAPLDAQAGLASMAAMMPSLTASVQNPLGLNVGLSSLATAMMPTATMAHDPLGIGGYDAGLPGVPTQPTGLVGAVDPRLADCEADMIAKGGTIGGVIGVAGGAVVTKTLAGAGLVGGIGVIVGGGLGYAYGALTCDDKTGSPSVASDASKPQPPSGNDAVGGSGGAPGGSSGDGDVVDGGEIDDDGVIDGGEIDQTPNPESGGGTLPSGIASKIGAVTAATANTQPVNQKDPSNVSQPGPETVAPADALALGVLVSLPNVSKVQQQTNPNPEGSMAPSGSADLGLAGTGGLLGGLKGTAGDPCVDGAVSPMAGMADLSQRVTNPNLAQALAGAAPAPGASATISVSSPTSAAAPTTTLAKPAATSVPAAAAPATVASAVSVVSAQPVTSAPATTVDRAAIVASPIVVSSSAVVLGSSTALSGLGGSALRLR